MPKNTEPGRIFLRQVYLQTVNFGWCWNYTHDLQSAESFGDILLRIKALHTPIAPHMTTTTRLYHRGLGGPVRRVRASGDSL